MKRGHTVLLLAILALPVVAGGDRPNHPGVSTAAPVFSAGQVLTIDANGKFGGAPQTTELQAGLGAALSTSSDGLVQVKSPVAGGGVMVDLQGRFQNAMTMTTDKNGNVVAAPCLSGAPSDATAEGK
jgi:hypothetical protein